VRTVELRQATVEALCAKLAGHKKSRPRQLHQIRLAIKHWRYAAEIARPVLTDDQQRTLGGALRRLQELGGASQDLANLLRRIDDERSRHRKKKRRRGLGLLLEVVAAAHEDAVAAYTAGLLTVPTVGQTALTLPAHEAV
jgi:CHAD domain-containing protein